MDNCKTRIVSYLFSQKGILPYLMERYSSLGTRIAAWMTGEKPILIIGGEPGNGKSLLMGELALKALPDLEAFVHKVQEYGAGKKT